MFLASIRRTIATISGTSWIDHLDIKSYFLASISPSTKESLIDLRNSSIISDISPLLRGIESIVTFRIYNTDPKGKLRSSFELH